MEHAVEISQAVLPLQSTSGAAAAMMLAAIENAEDDDDATIFDEAPQTGEDLRAVMRKTLFR